MKKQIIIYGNGNMAKMLYQFLKDHFQIAAFTVDAECIEETVFEGIPITPFTGVEKIYKPDNFSMIIAVGFVQMNTVRELKYLQCKKKGYQFINYIHPSVSWHDNVMLGENNIILEHVAIHPYTKIGNNNFISSNTNIGHGCIIKNNCWINSGVSIAGETTIENKCFLGINSSVGHELLIQEKTFISANTLISHNTDAGDVYLSPAGEKFRLKSDAFLKFSHIV